MYFGGVPCVKDDATWIPATRGHLVDGNIVSFGSYDVFIDCTNKDYGYPLAGPQIRSGSPFPEVEDFGSDSFINSVGS